MNRYRKKPVVIEATRFDGGVANATPIIDWVLDGGGTARWHEAEPPRLHSVSCRCDGRGVVPGDRQAVPCPEVEPKGLGVPETILIDTMEGTMRTDVGDWIIKGVAGEFYPCKPDIFATTYEPAP